MAKKGLKELKRHPREGAKMPPAPRPEVPAGPFGARGAQAETGADGESAAVPNFAFLRSRGPGSDPLHFFIARRWELMAPAMVCLVVALGLTSRSAPGAMPLLLFFAAMLLCLATPWLATIEGRLHHRSWKRYPLMLLTIALPMLLFGMAAAQWTRDVPALDWRITIKGYGLLVLLATVLLDRRLTSIVAATLGLWIGASLHSASLGTLGLLGAGLAIGLVAAMRQARLARDESMRHAAQERERHRAEELLREYEETGQGWFWETDRRGLVAYVSPRIAELLQARQTELYGRPFLSLFRLRAEDHDSERTLAFHLSTRSSFQDVAARAATDEQDERWWSISGRPVLDQFHNFMGFRGSGIDLTETRKSQQHVTRLARFDSLTKLANRFQMSEWLEKVIKSPRTENRACAVFLLDLDRFKHVNDTLGHPAGDALLKQVAERLRLTVANMGRVGRLGGDEFQVILPGYHQHEGLGHLARRIIENLSQPYTVDGTRVMIGASVGIAMCPEDGTSSETLIRNADLALYAAKDRGRGRHHFYDDDLHSDARERQQLEQDLRNAVEGGALELHYQPQIHTRTQTITGFEALLRWKHPRHGYLSPAKFVPVAEETGLVSEIGEWVLRKACRDLAAWPHDVRVAVNVSPLQFANAELPSIVAQAIADSGIEAHRLELEITESVFLGEDGSTEAMFGALKDIGVRLALDDFGTGYSSLGYLKKAPFDKIKIDQSFVRGACVEGSRNGAIISSIVSLAEALGMETTAEGVETFDELDLVRLLGCSHIQGYIYEKSLTSAEVVARLERGLTAVASGPRSTRTSRQPMSREVVLEHGGHIYRGIVRNISATGATVEGLWNVPVDTEFALQLAEGNVVLATARWCRRGRMGVEFVRPLDLDAAGNVQIAPADPAIDRSGEAGIAGLLRKTA